MCGRGVERMMIVYLYDDDDDDDCVPPRIRPVRKNICLGLLEGGSRGRCVGKIGDQVNHHQRFPSSLCLRGVVFSVKERYIGHVVKEGVLFC